MGARPGIAARGLGFALLTSALFAGSFIAGKHATVQVEPLTLSLMRYVVAGAFLGLTALALRREVPRVDARAAACVMLAGALGVAGYHFFFFAALRETVAVNAAIINGLSPVLTAMLAAALLGERLSRGGYFGVALAGAGAVLLITGADLGRATDLEFNLGDLQMLMAVGCWAGYTLVVRGLSIRFDGLMLTLGITLAGVLVLAALALAFENLRHPFEHLSAGGAWSVLYMGIGASGIGYWSYTAGIKALGPTRISALVYGTVPLFVAAIAYLLLGEAVTLAKGVSAALVVAGLWLVMRDALVPGAKTPGPGARAHTPESSAEAQQPPFSQDSTKASTKRTPCAPSSKSG